MMEKRALLAAMLSALFLAFYSQTLRTNPSAKGLNRQPLTRPATETGTASTQLMAHEPDRTFIYHIENEEVVSIHSDEVALEIGRASGAIRHVVLKRFLDEAKISSILFGSTLPLVQLQVGSEPMTILSVTQAADKAVVEAMDSANNKYHISYGLDNSNTLINIVLTHIDGRLDKSQGDVRLMTTWSKGDKLSDQHNRLEAFILEQGNGNKKRYRHFSSPWKKEINVPRGTQQLSLTERYFCQSIKAHDVSGQARLIPSPEGSVAAEMRFPAASHEETGALFSATVYVGPRDYFYLKKAGFADAFPIGIIPQIGLVLLLVLSWLAKLVHNYGVAMILFSALVTCAMAPFTLLGFRSMKRMQELKPKIDKLMEQHKGDSQRANKEVFALYKEHRINPLGGCLPMLLQMPVFIALFQGISHFIELRGASFLWIKDLSLPDRFAQLPLGLPVIGRDVNLLPVIMAAAMYFQTKASQQSMGTASSNPTAKMMSGPLMPILFFFMFYQFPAGLVLYWLTNTLVSMMWYRLAK